MDAVRINDDGTWWINPDRCVAYPDDESAYTGCLEIDGGAVRMDWARGSGFIYFIDVRVCVGDMVYEAVQRGLVPVGVR